MDFLYLDGICQIGVCTLGLGALLVLLFPTTKGWGFVIGFLGQPFWFITATINHQWGIFILSIAYTFVWGRGIYVWFFKKR